MFVAGGILTIMSGGMSLSSKSKWAPMTEVKSRKKPKNAERTAGVRTISFGQWDDPTIPGPFMYAQINGTVFPCNKAFPFLQSVGLKLSHESDTKFYDFTWSGVKGKHCCRTYSETHAKAISTKLIERCKDLEMEVDFTNGKWHPTEGLVVWNTTLNQLAIVGLDPFQKLLEDMFLLATVTRKTSLWWADHQACLLFHDTISNADIESHTDDILAMATTFGATINLIQSEEGDVTDNIATPREG